MAALRLLVFLIFLANANTERAREFLRGQWQVVEADFPDIGHCLMTEVLEYNLTLPRTDGTVMLLHAPVSVTFAPLIQ